MFIILIILSYAGIKYYLNTVHYKYKIKTHFKNNLPYCKLLSVKYSFFGPGWPNNRNTKYKMIYRNNKEKKSYTGFANVGFFTDVYIVDDK